MGQTRVDLQHLLEDLRDAYPDAIEETILSEVVANSLDSGAADVHVVGGLVEAPGLSVALTLNKGDFVRAGRRGITYLAYRKVLQAAVQAQLASWGEAQDREGSARRRAARPLG